MRKRLFALFLALVMVLGMLPGAAFAASTEEEALGEIGVYNGDYEMSYLSINGRVQKQSYTYYNYVSSNGQVKEIPCYCVNPNQYGVPQTVAPGESIKYLAKERASDPKVMGIVFNGYPTTSLEQLGLENRHQAYYATKMALWCYIISNWNINNLKVNPNLTGDELVRAKNILAAAKDIYAKGTLWNSIPTPGVTCTPDRDTAYPVTIDGRQYKQQVFTFRSGTWIQNLSVDVGFTDPDSVPSGTRITDLNGRDITAITTSDIGGAYGGQFKVLYPASSVEGQSGSVQLSFSCSVYKYAIFYATCLEKDKYGNLQNYIVDTDPTTIARLSAYSTFSDTAAPDSPEAPDTGLKITKLETGTDLPLGGALFEVIGPDGVPVGTFSTNDRGEIMLPVTLEGNYTVIEREPPAYHLLGSTTVQNVKVEYGKIAEVTFTNAPYGALRIEKRSDTGMNLPGAVITVTHIESGTTYTQTTNSAGVAIFDKLKPGAYRIQEVSAPSGWQLDDTVYTATVVTGETVTIPIVNKELPGLRIIKYDRLTMEAMAGVSFEIFRDNQSIGVYQTDALGEILLTDLPAGTYRVEERHTGDDEHIVDTTPQHIELKTGMGIAELVFFNDRMPGIHLIKVDSADLSKPIPNVKFRIEAVDGSYGPEEFTTDENGMIDLSKLPTAAYVVTELEAPGYIIDEAQRIIHLDANETAQFVFTNSIKSSLEILKLSSDGTPLRGVTFRIARIEDGSHYLDRITDAQGRILISGLEPGVYSAKELSTTADHIIDLREYHIELFPGQISTLVVENQKRPNLVIYKHDADTGEPIPNTVFLVRAADGHSVDEVKTDEDGKAVLENLLPGVYEVTEKSVPSPWLLDAPSQLVTLYPNRDHSVYFENHKKPSLTVNKIDSVTGDPIKGAKFQVWYASNHTDTGAYNDLGFYYSDDNGQFIIDALRDGWYKISEIEPPAGYALKAPSTQAVYIKGGERKVVTFENVPLSALVVWKYDSVTGEAVKDAVFQVKYLNGSGSGGTVIGTYKTSGNGSFTVTGLKAGAYVVEELASDSNHVIDTAPQTAYISGKEQDVVQLYFGNSPKGSLLVKKIDSVTHEPLSDVEFMVTTSDGTVVGDGNGKFVTDSAGTFLVEGIIPGTTLVVKETRAPNGYLLDDTPQTAKIKAGQTVTLEYRNQPMGSLIINKLDSMSKAPLEGVQFKITYADGKVVDAEGGQLSSNGIYRTDKNGQIIISGITGTLVATEVQSVPGYTIDEGTRSQTVIINPSDTQTLTFYNTPVGGLELIKTDEDTGKRIPKVVFEIRRMDGALVGTYTTDSYGRIRLPGLESGWYTAVETKAAKGYRLDDTPHTFQVKDGQTAVLRITNRATSGILIHKIDATTGEGIADISFLLYDSRMNPLGQYTSDQDGFVYITDLDHGKYHLRELESEGYILDKRLKTVYVKSGETIEIEWENTPITGQIQIHKYAADFNTITGTAPGASLQGAVYEIIDARSGKVVDYITTDARGVAASKPLPLARYQAREVTAPPYWQLDHTVHDVTLEYAGQIIKLTAYDKPAKLGVSITKRGNFEVMAGTQMRYDFTVANTSNVPLESFFWHDRIPTDVARPMVLTTGTYSARLNYRILYKTNYMSSYQVLASNLLTSNNYSFSLNAIPMQVGEVVTDIYFDFGKVPVGFQSTSNPSLSVIVNGTAVNGYQMVNRADAGGKYQNTWQTAQANWITIIRRVNTIPTLPKTGY